MHWCPYCQEKCFHSAIIPLATTKCPDQMTPVHIPPEYQDLQEEFSKEKASRLPPHLPYDCTITLLSGASPMWGRVYLLYLAEQRAIEEYMQEALQQEYNKYAPSPASAVFSPWRKKG